MRDNAPTTAGIDADNAEIKPRILWLIETRSNALVPSRSERIVPGGPALAELSPRGARAFVDFRLDSGNLSGHLGVSEDTVSPEQG